MHYLDESHILIFLMQLGIILLLARFTGEIFRKFKQPVLTAELLIGILLGPTILGRFFPGLFHTIFPDNLIQRNMLETTAWIGVLFLLLDTGLEINFSSAWKQRGNALIISIIDIIVPMLIAFLPCFFLPDSYLVDPDKRLQFALFMATVMTISAMPVASRVLHDLKLLKTDLGFLTMSALAVNDIIGWALFTIILGLFMQSAMDIGHTATILIFTVGFSVLALTGGRYFSNKVINFFQNRNFPEPSSSFTFACLVGIAFGAITQKIGVHALFGFFIAGVVVGEAKNLKEETRSVISQMVHALFVPVFFVNIGLKIDFAANFNILLVLLITVIGIFGRYLGAWIGVSFSKVPRINKALIAIAHTPGGMMEIVVALMALELKLIKADIFIAIVCSAVFSSMVMGPWMSVMLKKRKNVKLSTFMNFAHGILFLKTDDKKEAIGEFLNSASNIVKNLPIDKIKKEIFEREDDFPTSLGHGVAIPHIRTDYIFEPLLLFGFSTKGIDWNSADGKPVQVIFFLLTPETTNDLHIEILSKVARLLERKGNLEGIIESDSKESLINSLKTICE